MSTGRAWLEDGVISMDVLEVLLRSFPKVTVHMFHKKLLVVVRWELIATHWAFFPVTSNVALKFHLIESRWESQLTDWALLSIPMEEQ